MSDRLETSRRSFLRGALSLAVAATVVRPTDLFAGVPWIYGDGIHDDTAGLQALLDGKPFRCDLPRVGWLSKEGRVEISGGYYVVSRAIVVKRPLWLTGAIIDARDMDTSIMCIDSEGSYIANCTFIGRFSPCLEVLQ